MSCARRRSRALAASTVATGIGLNEQEHAYGKGSIASDDRHNTRLDLEQYHHFTRKNASSSTSIWLRVVSFTGVDAFSMTPMSDSHSQAMMTCSMS